MNTAAIIKLDLFIFCVPLSCLWVYDTCKASAVLIRPSVIHLADVIIIMTVRLLLWDQVLQGKLQRAIFFSASEIEKALEVSLFISEVSFYSSKSNLRDSQYLFYAAVIFKTSNQALFFFFFSSDVLIIFGFSQIIGETPKTFFLMC